MCNCSSNTSQLDGRRGAESVEPPSYFHNQIWTDGAKQSQLNNIVVAGEEEEETNGGVGIAPEPARCL